MERGCVDVHLHEARVLSSSLAPIVRCHARCGTNTLSAVHQQALGEMRNTSCGSRNFNSVVAAPPRRVVYRRVAYERLSDNRAGVLSGRVRRPHGFRAVARTVRQRSRLIVPSNNVLRHDRGDGRTVVDVGDEAPVHVRRAKESRWTWRYGHRRDGRDVPPIGSSGFGSVLVRQGGMLRRDVNRASRIASWRGGEVLTDATTADAVSADIVRDHGARRRHAEGSSADRLVASNRRSSESEGAAQRGRTRPPP